MASLPPVQPRLVGILILDDDPASQGALRQVLDEEGWRVRIVPDTRALLAELATGEWSLVIANIELAGLNSPAFITLKELASVPPEEVSRVRVLFLIPEFGAAAYVPALEQARLPFVGRPFHLHDFLEKISDLLVEIKAIDAPIRKVRYEFGSLNKKKKKAGSRETSMFASRDSYSYTEEELAEYEHQEKESSLLRKKRQKPITDLGKP